MVWGYYCRCNSENCRALLERYDAPPAIDAVNEEAHGLQVNGIEVKLYITYLSTTL